MTRESSTRKRSTESRLIFTLLGVTVWIAAGFVIGLVAGVVSEEPELLVGHMAGRDTEIEWAAGGSESGDTVALIEANDDGGALAPVGAAPRSLLDDPPPQTTSILKDETASVEAAQFAAAKKAGEAKPPTTAGPRFLIQVGAYDSRASASEVAETLRGKGYAVEVLSNSDDGRYRVRVGPVAARDRAEGLAKRLEDDEGLPTWILRVRES